MNTEPFNHFDLRSRRTRFLAERRAVLEAWQQRVDE
jgi:hypothetical protein